MKIKELIKLDMGEAVEWLIENKDKYDLVKVSKCSCKIGDIVCNRPKYCKNCGGLLKAVAE